MRLALVLVAGLSYEIIRLPPKRGRLLSNDHKPGVVQNITTQELETEREVAIEALKESLKLEPQNGEAALAPLS